MKKIPRLRKSKKARIEIIPMIDVMFFLLATFILASLSMQHLSGIAVNLSKGQASQVNFEKNVNLSINQDGLIFLNQEPIEIQEIAKKIKIFLSDQEKMVIIAADKDAKQGVVTQAMLEARKGGAQHFSIIVRK